MKNSILYRLLYAYISNFSTILSEQFVDNRAHDIHATGSGFEAQWGQQVLSNFEIFYFMKQCTPNTET